MANGFLNARIPEAICISHAGHSFLYETISPANKACIFWYYQMLLIGWCRVLRKWRSAFFLTAIQVIFSGICECHARWALKSISVLCDHLKTFEYYGILFIIYFMWSEPLLNCVSYTKHSLQLFNMKCISNKYCSTNNLMPKTLFETIPFQFSYIFTPYPRKSATPLSQPLTAFVRIVSKSVSWPLRPSVRQWFGPSPSPSDPYPSNPSSPSDPSTPLRRLSPLIRNYSKST